MFFRTKNKHTKEELLSKLILVIFWSKVQVISLQLEADLKEDSCNLMNLRMRHSWIMKDSSKS